MAGNPDTSSRESMVLPPQDAGRTRTSQEGNEAQTPMTMSSGVSRTNSVLSAHDRKELPPLPPTIPEVKDYSDLEVVASIPPAWERDKMPVMLYTDHKEPIGPRPGDLLSPATFDSVPAYPGSVRTSTLSNMPLTKGDYAEWPGRDGATLPPRQEKRILGMRARTASALAIGLLVGFLTLLAVILSVTLTMRTRTKSSNLTNTGTDSSSTISSNSSSGLLSNTQLAAVNWTDSSGTDRSAVFFQDHEASLMAALIDTISNEWTYKNVTGLIMNATGASRLDILSGTPLAAVSAPNGFQVSLYYLTSSYNLAEMFSPDIVNGPWYSGGLAAQLAPQVRNGSRFSAFWQQCNNCSDTLALTWQESDGTVQLGNLTDANPWQLAGSLTTTALNGTGLAIRPFTDEGGVGTFGTAANAFRVYHLGSSGLVELEEGPGTNYTWQDTAAGTISSSELAEDAGTELAAITYGDHGLTKSVVNHLRSNGTVQSFMYDGTNWTNGVPSLTSSSQTLDELNLTAIASAQNMRVYGVSNGTIYEFQLDDTDVLSWTLKSTVAGG